MGRKPNDLEPPGDSDYCDDPDVTFVGDVEGTTTSNDDTKGSGMEHINPVLRDHIPRSLGDFEMPSPPAPALISEEEGENMAGPNKKRKTHDGEPMDEDYIDPDL